MFNRAPLTTAMEGDFDTGNVRYKARERYSFGVSDPRGIYRRCRCVINKFCEPDIVRPHFHNRTVRFMKKFLVNNLGVLIITQNLHVDCKRFPNAISLEQSILDKLGRKQYSLGKPWS